MRARILAVALVAAAAIVLVTRNHAEAGNQLPPIGVIAHRVEQLRGLQFKHLPKVRRVTARQLQRRSDSSITAKQRRRAASEQDLLKLLGLENRKATPADVGSTAGILGYYDPPTQTLTIVTDAQGSRAQKELTYAHELTHALEDQHFGLPRFSAGDDAAQARRAVVEGSARFTETAYARKYFNHGASVATLAQRVPASSVKGDVNYFINQDRFAYLDGARYIARLVKRGGQAARDRAFAHPPATTADVLHAERKPADPAPLDVGKYAKGFTQVESGSMGEFDTSQLLLFGAFTDKGTTPHDAAVDAAGWAGGHYELWRAGGKSLKGCSRPCVERDLLAIRWRFENPGEAAQLKEGLGHYLADFQKLTPDGPGLWRGKVASAALRQVGRTVTLTFAPAPQLAKLVAKGS